MSSYDNEDISEGVISRTEPDGMEIETIILEFLKKPRREEVDDESEKSYSSHHFPFWYPAVEVFETSPYKYTCTEE
mgnify:CR=1 FL=1